MKFAIIAFDSLSNPSRVETISGVKNHELQAKFNAMKLDKTPVNGLTVVELWTEDRGCRARYFAEAKPTQPQPKHTMKKTFAVIPALIAFLLLGATAIAQTYVNGTYTPGTTQLYPASAVSNVGAYNVWLDVRKCDNVALQCSFTTAAAGTNIVLNFVGSTDGASASVITNDVAFSVVIPYNSVTVNRTTTNWNKGGIGYIKLYSWGPNYDADATPTNVVIKYGYLIK